MDISDWLHSLGLEQYAQLFAENGIDFDVLADLTEPDLESLGVVVGHRRKLLRAIAAMSNMAVANNEPSAPEAAERRQITLMFCDLVGSSSLTAQLDPEEMREIIRAYQDCYTTIIARYEEFIAQFTGDGMLVYFGYPVAHEDDAERAVRASLDVVAAITGLKTPVGDPLQVRIGIATGLVIVGDLLGQGLARERAVIGDTPNLGARLQALAGPGAIVVSAATRQLLGDRFILRGLGSIQVKGFPEPVEAWAVEGALESESRFEAMRTGRLTGFVGRDTEVELLHQRRELAWEGVGQIVLVSGEAGIGKSRFVTQFSELIPPESHIRLRYQCSPYHTASALHPVIEQIKRAAKFADDDRPDIQLEKLKAMLAGATPDLSRATQLLATLLSIPCDDSHQPLRLSPMQHRRQTLAALLDQLEALARNKPVVMLFEDVHWADPTTLELLDLMVDRVRHLPVLALITHRPEFESPWIGLDNVSLITLERLSRQQVQTMIGWLSGTKPMPGEVVAQIFAKTDGVPLFVEEMTKAVLESQLLREDKDQYRIDGKLPPLAIPVTLQDSLMARLDRLAPVREIAQVGAAIGREFSYALLHQVAGCPTATLDNALEQLEAAELVFRSGTAPQARYRFKHALVRDAAYESMLKSRRQILHRRIAETLRDRFPAVAASEPEVIAQHFAEAGLTEPAVDWWSTAGEQAARRSAFAEASAHLRDAIALADTLRDEPANRKRQIRAYVAYGETLTSARSPGARETIEAFSRARELAVGLPDAAERYRVYHGLWTSSVVRADVASMRDLAYRFRAEVEQRQDATATGLAHRFLGVFNWMAGNPTLGRTHLEAALAAYQGGRGDLFDFNLELHPDVAVTLQLAMALWLLGERGQANEFATKGLALAVRAGHVPTVIYGYTWKGTLNAIDGNYSATLACMERISEIEREHDLPFWRAIAVFFGDWARWLDGDRSVGLSNMQQSVEFFTEQGLAWYSLLTRMLIAVPQAEVEGSEAALATLDGVISEIESSGLRWLEAEVYRVRGELLANSRPTESARCYEQAIAVARRQAARSFELRAEVGLAGVNQVVTAVTDPFIQLHSS